MRRNSLIIILIVLVAIGIGVWYVEQPDRVVAQATKNLSEAKTGNYTATFTLENVADTQAALGEAGSVVVGLDGVYSRPNKGPLNLDGKINVTAKTNSVSVQGDGQLKMINDKIYLLLNNIPPTLAPFAPLKGQWLSFDRGTVAEAPQTTPLSLPFQSVKRISTERIDGVTAVKYRATLSTDGVIALADGLNYQLRGNHLTPDQVNSLKTNLASQSATPIDIWVQQWTHRLKQIGLTTDAPNGSKVKVVIKIRSLNQPVTITKPEGARSLQDVLQSSQPEPSTSPTPSATPEPK